MAETAGSNICGNMRLFANPPIFWYKLPAAKVEIVIFDALNTVLMGGLLKIFENVFSPLLGTIIKGVLINTIATVANGPSYNMAAKTQINDMSIA